MTRARTVLHPVALLAALTLVASTLLAAASAAGASAPTSLRVDFAPRGAAVARGYRADSGAAYSRTRGSGWQRSDGHAVSLVSRAGTTRSRRAPDARYRTWVRMATPATRTTKAQPARWATSLANGLYTVTVGIGDGSTRGAAEGIWAQPGTTSRVQLVRTFRPSARHPFLTATARVRVTRGLLVLQSVGTSTALDFVTANRVVTPPPKPTPKPTARPTPTPTTKPTATPTPTPTPTSTHAPALVVASGDNVTLGLAAPRLVFSTALGQPYPPARSLTLTNTGDVPVTVGSLQVTGADAASFALAAGQATALTLAPGATASVAVDFRPTAPTGCPTSTTPYVAGNVTRDATLTWSGTDGSAGSAALAGIVACGQGGNNEPVLGQVLHALGYTTVVGTDGQRFLGPLRPTAGTDEVVAPYFRAADSTRPVTLTPVAHYSGPDTAASYQSTGWYAEGATMTAASACSSACRVLWQFPADPSSGGYAENQKLLPAPAGTTTFTPSGTFGLFTGDYTDVNFSDDALNRAHSTGNTDLPVPHYLHDLRVFPAYGPGHAPVPGTYLVTVDVTRVPAYKNNDFQDVVLLLQNAVPAVIPAPGPGRTTDLTRGGTVASDCSVTGFDGILPDTAGDQCVPGNISFGPDGLSLTSTAGQLANQDQQNAVYSSFDASRGPFTVRARVVGPLSQLTQDYQQVGAWFGPDQKNFVKVEAEHNGAGAPHLTMFFSENGVAGTVASVEVPELTTAHTVDLILKGDTSVPDPIAGGDDTYAVRGYPLDELTAYYSIDGGAPVQVGNVKSPADVLRWFSPAAKAGIEVANPGSSQPIAATFSSFGVTAG